MNRVDCTGTCGNSAPFDDGEHPEGWRYVLPRPKKPGMTTQPHDGMCPACFAAKSQRPTGKRMPGGPAFDWQIAKAGGVPIPPDRQGKLF